MIVVYSTHCPQCMSLCKLLEMKHIEYELIENKELMIQLGFKSAPMLKVNEKILDYSQAKEWIKQQ